MIIIMTITTSLETGDVSPCGSHLVGVRDDQRPLKDQAPKEGGVPDDGGDGDHPAHGVAVKEHRGARHRGLHLGAVPASPGSVDSLTA